MLSGRPAYLFDWRRSGGWWYWFPVNSVRFHQFDASAVGIEKVRLTLAILANLYFDRSVVILARRASFENGHGFLNIRSDQTNVILHSHLLCVRTLVVKHELKIIVTVRNSHIDPAQNCAGGAAAPELLEAKNLAIEFHGRLKRAN